MKFRFYHYEKCSTCRRARKWLESKGIEVEPIPIREHPPGKEDLRRLLQGREGSIRRAFNTSSPDYREPAIKESIDSMTEAEAIDLLSKKGNLIRRPVLIGEGLVLQGFNEGVWEKSIP